MSAAQVVLPFYSIDVLVKPLTEEFGWTRAQFQSSILVVWPRRVDRYVVDWLVIAGGRTALVGLFGLSLGFLLAAFIRALWMLYLPRTA